MNESVILITVAPTITIVLLLWLLHLVVRSTAPDTPREPRRPETAAKTRNEFMVRAKPLEDTWRGKGHFRGWFTFVGVIVAGTTGRVMYEEFMQSGRFFSVSSAQYMVRVFGAELPEFLTVVSFQYCFCLASFAIQKAMVVWSLGSRGRRVLEIMHMVVMAYLFMWSCQYAYKRIEVLSFTARFAIVTQGAVLCMKMYSYTVTNAQLYRLVTETKQSDKHSETVDIRNLSFEEVLIRLKQRGIEQGGRQVQGRIGDSEDEHARRLLERLSELDEYRATVYPKNVTLCKFVDFTTMPVLVYEPKYPRSSHVDVWYVLQKTAELIGLNVVGWLVFEVSIISTIQDQSIRLYAKVIEVFVPVSLLFLVLFFVVFDCIFPALAELTRLADRGFYGDWWNSTSFADFSSSWNKPVHEFLLRHVHAEAANSLGLPRKYAAMLTFTVSIILHEIIITALLGTFRPYLAFFSIFQIPLWPIMRSPVFKHKLLGNIFFWSGLLLGITLVVVLYFSEYCARLDQCKLD